MVQLDRKIGDLPVGAGGVLELLVSDKKHMPAMGKSSSYSARQNSLALGMESSENAPVFLGGELPVVEKMAALGGIETLVKSALNKLQKEYLDRSLAKIWIDFLTLYTTFFAPLPGFESRYFNEDRVNLIIRILTRRFDGQHKVPDPSQASATAS